MPKKIIFDLDGTLAWPTPYADLASAGPIEEQHRIAQTPDFKHRLLNAPVAPWVRENGFIMPNLLKAAGSVVITGRWPYNAAETNAWLRAHIGDIPIRLVPFKSWDTYLQEKYDAIEQYIAENPGDHVVMFEDAPAVCEHFRNRPDVTVFQITDGELPADALALYRRCETHA